MISPEMAANATDAARICEYSQNARITRNFFQGSNRIVVRTGLTQEHDNAGAPALNA